VEQGKVALFSRTLDDVSAQFPEIVESARQLTAPVIADGEIIAARNGVALPFALLQRRLGRKRPTPAIMADIPVVLVVFDLLYLDGHLLIDEPLSERKRLAGAITWSDRLTPAPARLVTGSTQLEPLFQEALQRRNEGLMLKDANSTYVPGKRGMSWMKWKQAMATLDVVVTGVELGHGKRRDVLSDYTFAVRKDGTLLNIGKAYSGLTDEEIRTMTEFFTQHTVQTFGRFRTVEPVVVLEVAFNSIQRSRRHKSGFALRFPRIVRIRHDKSPEEIDTIDYVERLYLSTGQDEHL
jgi:DNA ligase-1